MQPHGLVVQSRRGYRFQQQPKPAYKRRLFLRFRTITHFVKHLLDSGVQQPCLGSKHVHLLSVAGIKQTPPPHLISGTQVCKLVLGFGVVGVPVRVQLERQLSVGLLDVPDRGRLTHPQDLVEVSPTGGGRREG